MLIGGTLSLVGFSLTRGYIKTQADARFEALAAQKHTAITAAIARYNEAVRSIANFMTADASVTRRQFSIFAADSLRRLPAIQALQWVPRVTKSQRPAFEEIARRDGLVDFNFREAGPNENLVRAGTRTEYFPVFFTEPLAGNAAVAGFDLASNAARMAALAQARDRGVAVATERVNLYRGGSNQFGFLLFVPVFGTVDLITVGQRRAALRGFSVGVIRVDELIREALAPFADSSSIDVYVFDDSASSENRFLAHYPSNARDAGIEPLAESAVRRNGTLEKIYFIGGRRWTIAYRSAGGRFSFSSPVLDAVFGAALLLSMAFGIWIVSTRNRVQEVKRLVAEKTLELTISNKALAESDARHRRLASDLRAVIDTAVDGIIIIGQDGTVETFNPACTDLFGYDAEEVIGRNVKMLMPDSYAVNHDQYLDNYHQTGDAKIIGVGRDVVARRKDGTEFPMALSVGEIMSSGGKRFVGVIHDISAIKAAEVKLRDAIESFSDAFALFDAENRLVICNTAYKKMRPRIADQMQPDADMYELARMGAQAVVDAGLTPDAENWLERTLQVYRNPGTSSELRYARGAWVRRLAIRTADGGTIDIGTDITDLKNIQTQLEENARELTRSNEELEQFAYLASHDMQEPLRVIGSYCDLLRRRYSDRLDDDGREFLDYAVDGANRMRSLIDDLLIYSRVGRGELVTEPVSLSSTLETALQGLRGLIEDKNATVTADALPTVTANVNLLTQLFQNLVGNGIKFHGDAKPKIHVSCEDRGPECIISVRDNGIGIEPEFADRVFRMFQRLHGRGDYPGNGLGLALCKRIVERHGGRIWIEPTDGPGTTVSFTLTITLDAETRPQRETTNELHKAS